MDENQVNQPVPRTSTKSEQIRALGAAGLKPAEIAKRLGIRYQHAFNVLASEQAMKKSGTTENIKRVPASATTVEKPFLSSDALKKAGFTQIGRWILTDDILSIEGEVPHAVGVYAFVRSGIALYVGVATMGLAKRLYFYAKPGVSQRTSQRLNRAIKSELQSLSMIEIYAAMPPDLEWNGLPVHGSAGLELGLIKKFALEWNMRSSG
ncbi:GIY-YIG nuclease family protein [Rhodospirillum sp. A1_3_36]|uniref:GIY-YIG nuclease family protein n=1 Tax=Rhodospirillum sp. A1_3_36 TaxID=3391666 RepID=UPI0039A6660F